MSPTVPTYSNSNPNSYAVENATCTFCGCMCDDIWLTVEGNHLTRATNACTLGEAWFAEQALEDRPFALMDGREATTAEGVEAAAQILAQARYPLIYGLSGTTCEAQGEAVALADLIGANIDTPTSAGIVFQGGGQSTATLGEVKNRADLIIYWGCNPAESHPRHLTRYTLTPPGIFIPHGRQDRTLAVVDVRRTPSANDADIFIQIKPDSDFEALWALRALVKGRPISPAIEEATGVPLATLQDLAQRMKQCRYGALFFGMGLSGTRGRHFNSGAVLSLTTDLNEFTHFVAMPVQAYGNAAGAANVLAWQTGYPYAVNFSRGFPRFNPGEFTTAHLLARDEADAALVVAGDPAANLSPDALEQLGRIPIIALGSPASPRAAKARVAFTTATYGINTGGTVYRMDDVAITLRPAFPSPYPTAEAVLRAIRERAGELLHPRRLDTAPKLDDAASLVGSL